jgi:hypothetical protein
MNAAAAGMRFCPRSISRRWKKRRGRENLHTSWLTLHFVGVQPNDFMKSLFFE